jgi:hypothetical protein
VPETEKPRGAFLVRPLVEVHCRCGDPEGMDVVSKGPAAPVRFECQKCGVLVDVTITGIRVIEVRVVEAPPSSSPSGGASNG